MSEPALVAERLGFGYKRDAWVFRNYSAAIEPGSIFAILGPNGRGKTTLLKVLAGILTPREGTVVVDGPSAYVPQLFSVSFGYSVLDMVLMGRARHIGLFASPSALDIAAARKSLDRFGMSDFVDSPFGELSGGQRQLVILARAFASEATMIVLDEPTSSLDLRAQGTVLMHLRRLVREEGVTIVFTTHDPNQALRISDRVLLMFGEREYACGSPVDVLTDEAVGRLYGVEMRRLHGAAGGDCDGVTAMMPFYDFGTL